MKNEYDPILAYQTKKYLENNGFKDIGKYIRIDKEIEVSSFRFRPSLINLSYLPIGITEQGEICCLPNLNEAHTMGVIGDKGMGKTLFCHRVIDWFFHFYNHHIAIANDFQNECYAWSAPNRSPGFQSKLKYIGEKPTPLPVFLLIPNLKDKKKFGKYITKLNIKLPWEDFINDIDKFENLDKTEKYFKQYSEELKGCESFEEIRETLMVHMPDKNAKTMRNKILAVIKSYENDGILSFDKKITGKIKVTIDGKETTDVPAIQIMRCNLIPIFLTNDLITKTKYFTPLISYFIAGIIDHQKLGKDKDFENRKVLIFIDELNRLVAGKNKDGIIEKLKECVMNGRMLNISLLWVSQTINDLKKLEFLNDLSKYTFVFKNKDVGELKRKLNISQKICNEIKDYKKFDFWADCSDAYFVLYDNLGNKRITKNPMKLKLIPPISAHASASAEHLVYEAKIPQITFGTLAKQELKRKGIDLINVETNENVFGQNYKLGNKEPLNNYQWDVKKPSFFYGFQFGDAWLGETINLRPLDYEAVKRLGFFIYSALETDKRLKHPLTIYSLIKKGYLSKLPPQANLFHDKAPNGISVLENLKKHTIQLSGKNTDTQRFNYSNL